MLSLLVVPLSAWTVQELQYFNCGDTWWDRELSPGLPEVTQVRGEDAGLSDGGVSQDSHLPTPWRAPLAMLLSSLEQMWIGETREKEERLGSREAVQAISGMGVNLWFEH